MVITHDFHIHTNLSLCASREATLDMYAEKCKEFGIKKMAITDHMWDHNIPDWPLDRDNFYPIQSEEYVLASKKKVEEANKRGANFLFGCEAEYSYKHRKPAITPEIAEQMEVVLVPNSHTHKAMPSEFYNPPRRHAEFMLDAFMDIVNSDVAKYITAIPHPFMAVACPYGDRSLLSEITDDEFKRCFSSAAEKGIALELNPNYIKDKTLSEVYSDPIFRMFSIGKECGCKFTIGTDAHSSEGMDNFALAYLMCSVLGLTEDDFHPLTK